MSPSESNKPTQRWRWQWQWVVPVALLPGAIVNVMNPYQTPGLRIVARVLLTLTVILLGVALYVSYRERRRLRDASHGT